MYCTTKNLAAQAAVAIGFQGKIVQNTVSLGFTIASTYKHAHAQQNRRVNKAIDFCNKVDKLPRDKKLRNNDGHMGVIPRITHGIESALPTQRNLVKLRSKMRFITFSRQRCLREPHVTMVLLFETHRSDPWSACIYKALSSLISYSKKDPAFAEAIKNLWTDLINSNAPGSINGLNECFEYLGWTITDTPWIVDRVNDTRHDLLHKNSNNVLHELRRSIRWGNIRLIPEREDMTGLAGLHVSMTATTALHRNLKSRDVSKYLRAAWDQIGDIAPNDKGDLESILSGSVRCGTRLRAANLVDSSICVGCGIARED